MDKLDRARRVAFACKSNPELVNPALDAAVAAMYYQVLYDFADILACTLDDLKEPADTPPMNIQTFGEPVKKGYIRANPA